MIMIVEGPDGAGKTTTIEEILRSNPGSIKLHFGAPATPEEAENYFKVYANAILSADPKRLTVFDRCWYSDMVYGPVMRGKQEMSDLHSKMLDAMVATHGGGLVVYCTAPVKILWARCQKRGESYIKNIEQLGAVSDGYVKVIKASSLPVIRYDTAARW